MQFWHRLALAQLITFAAVVLVVTASRYQVHRLYNGVIRAAEEYDELRTLAVAAGALSEARTQMVHEGKLQVDTRTQLAEALDGLRADLTLQASHTLDPSHQQEEFGLLKQCAARIEELLQRQNHGADSFEHDLKLIDSALADMDALLASMDEVVMDAHEAAVQQLERAKKWGILFPLAAMTLAILAGLWQYFSVIRPVNRLKAATSRMTRGDLSARVDESSSDELGLLAADFNKMANQLEVLYRDMDEEVRRKGRELAHAERLTSIGFLAAGVAHEINNPLSIIHGYAQEARQLRRTGGSGNDDVAQVLDVIMEESSRCRDIIRRLLRLASPGDSSCGTVDMKEVIDSTIDAVEGLPRYRTRRVETDLSSVETLVEANRDEIKQVLLNLLINGLEATESGGTVRIACSRQGDQVVTEVTDDGCGMTIDTLARVFDPFYTTRKFNGHRGVGLGLSVSYAIVQQHGGQLTAHSEGLGLGSRFTITMPAATHHGG